MHANLSHLLLNAMTFWFFALPLEQVIGSMRFIALYAFGLAVSDAGTWFRYRGDPNYASLGASGAILAVLFAAIVYFPRQSILILPIPVPIPAPLFAVCYLLFSFYSARAAAWPHQSRGAFRRRAGRTRLRRADRPARLAARIARLPVVKSIIDNS